ncbi:MAG: DUF1565 domain-containing protein [Candidatus Moranbacteria bacterium]|nr:DUF1565 domain-containing protein [Candidatus Moranbacteria bacterium]
MKNSRKGLKSSSIGLLIFIIGGFFCMANEVTLARTYDLYVEAQAAAGGDGSQARPYNSIGKALSQTKEDQIVFVKNGLYQEQIVIPRQVEVLGEDEKRVIIDGGDGADKGDTVYMNHKTKLKNVTVKGGYVGIRVPKRAGVKVDNVTIKKAKKDGVYLEGDKKTRRKDRYERDFEDCKIIDNGAKGMYVKKSQFSIEESEIEDNEEEGIDLRKYVKGRIEDNEFDDNGESHIETKIDKIKLKIKDNNFEDGDRSAIALQSYQGSGGYIYLKDNKIKDNKHYGIKCKRMSNGPAGGWASKLMMIGNKFASNDKGDFSKRCKIDR